MRRRHCSSIILGLDRHDGVGANLAQLSLLLPPLPLSGTILYLIIYTTVLTVCCNQFK